jgi:DNA primase
LIFPIRNDVNQLVGFGGRVLTKDSKYAKYLNTGETIAYKKREILYGYSRARKRIKITGQAIIVEGYTDVNLMDRADARNVVGVCGTSFTDEQCKLITRYTKACNVYIGDGDKAGFKAAKRVIEKHWLHSTHVGILLAKDGEDPASMAVAHGSDLLDNLTEICPVELIYKLAGEDREKNPTKEDQINATLKSISLCPSAVKRHVLLEQLSECSKIPVRALTNDINRFLAKIIYR